MANLCDMSGVQCFTSVLWQSGTPPLLVLEGSHVADNGDLWIRAPPEVSRSCAPDIQSPSDLCRLEQPKKIVNDVKEQGIPGWAFPPSRHGSVE